MTTLADFQKTNLVDDHTADDYNFLLAGILRGYVRNVETITSTKTLTDADCQVQILTPSGANRNVLLPPEAVTNHAVYISCGSASSYALIVKDDSGVMMYSVLNAGQSALFLSDGSNWKVFHPADYSDTSIKGMTLSYASASTISVSTGMCRAQNGDLIVLSSTLTSSSLTLTASTLHHVYIYLSSGSPTLEVTTTAPTTWVGTAKSKTGDTSRRYLGSILSNASGQVQKFYMVGNKINYVGGLNAAPFRIIASGTATTATAISVSAVVPTTATAVVARIFSGANQSLYLGDSTLSTSNFMFFYPAIVDDYRVDYVEIARAGGIYYMYGASITSGDGFNFDVVGYIFER